MAKPSDREWTEAEFEKAKKRVVRKITATLNAIGAPKWPEPSGDVSVRHIGITPHCKHGEGETCNECVEWTVW